ncbi:MAG: Flp pilus assembly complex ATPase component TadA [Candidatus Omnitrophica bacterium]|jgi:septum site-determining protein MinD|nr:Flp pilus assembly complex ATPase component TadA [Candidatus Omnitrophota bacterium]
MARIITIFSTKGGVGKTLVATSLAVSLAQDEAKKTCLIDLDLQVVGDMARMLDLHPQKAMVDLIGLIKKKPQEVKIKDFLLHSPALGIDFIPAVLKPQSSPHLDADKIKDVMELLEKNYDYIIIDAGKSFSEVFINVLNQSNLILLAVTPDVLSIYQTKWALDTLQFLHFPMAMIRIILNRAESVSGISWQEVRVSIPADIIARIPSEGRVAVQAVNRGVPIVIDNPKAKISQAIKAFAHDIATQDKLFLEHHQIGELGIKEAPVERNGNFWQSQGMTEPLAEPSISEEIDEILLLKRRIHSRLIEELNLKRMDSKFFSDSKKTKELRLKAEIMVANFLAEEAGSLISSSDVRRKLVKEILDEALGLGPLEDLLAEPGITDIMVNNKDEIYIERGGKIELTSKKFISNDQVKTIIERIIAPIGRRIDESVPMVDARLPDGSRVNAIIPPLSLTGPSLTIRKFRKERFKTEELIELNTLNQPMADFIKACVVARKNIIVSGGTGSGKTTILNVLSAFIPDNERIVTIEDAAELKLHQEHWIRLESRPPNIEGRGAITIRDLFRNTLRMRPDRILIGECRGIETLDMLQAMNTGHDGSMTTVHANSTQDVFSRLDSMILMAGVELPIRAIREMIASAIDMVVHTARLSDGTRKIIQVTEVAGMKDEMHIDLRDVFTFRQSGIDTKGNILGNFTATGYVPSFIEEMNMKGIILSKDIFKASQ